MRRRLRKIALHNEALADRNWELQEAEERARSLFESQGDLIVLRDAEGRITFVNDAYCELAAAAAQRADRQPLSRSTVLEQGDTAIETNGTRIHDQKIATPLGPRWIAWREGLVRSTPASPPRCNASAATSPTAPKPNARSAEARDQADAANRAKSRFLAMASPRNSHAAQRHHRHERPAARYRR